jgi:alkaline phosphatase
MGFIQMRLPKRIRHRLARTKRLEEARQKHREWLRSNGLDNIKIPKDRGDYVPDWKPDPDYPPLGNKIPVGGGVKNDIMTRLKDEPEAVQQEILRKARRTAPAYNKGGYQYITEDAEFNSLGNKGNK